VLGASHVTRKAIHVITPTTSLRVHWNRESESFGINLVRRSNNNLKRLHSFGTQDLPLGIAGISATYHQVAVNADVHATCIDNSDNKALVILDECHHAGDQKPWGDAIKQAFEFARFRLHLSGTPFRNDGNVIPWVKFDINGVAIATGIHGYTYSYLQAMEDDVCRPIAFDYRNLNLEYTAKGRDWNVDFTDDLDGDGASRRLRSALSIDSGLVEDMVKHADAALSEIRSRGGQFEDAAAILVAMTIGHAFECAEVIARVSGEVPTIVVSDNETADDELEAFRKGRGRWVVAVRMVSEGVDIPRLMVGVYATNIVSTLFFRQFVGRVVRVRYRGMREMAFIFMPADERLKLQASEILNEVRQFIRDKEQEYPKIKKSLEQATRSSSIALKSSRLMNKGIIIGGYEFTPEEVENAGEYRYTQIESDQYTNEQIALHLALLRDEKGKDYGFTGGRRVA
jgi:superfamily II DNA or RNA helicase